MADTLAKAAKADEREDTHDMITFITVFVVIFLAILTTLPVFKDVRYKRYSNALFIVIYISLFFVVANLFAKVNNAPNTYRAKHTGFENDYKVQRFVDIFLATFLLINLIIPWFGPDGFKVISSRLQFRVFFTIVCIFVFIAIAFVVQHKFTKTRVDFMRDGSGFIEHYINAVPDVYSLETYGLKPVFEGVGVYKENPIVNKETYTTKLAVYDSEDKCPDTYIDEGDGKKSSDGSYCISVKNVDFNYSNASDLSRYSYFYDKGKTMSSTTCEDDNCIYIPIIKHEVNRQESGKGTSSTEQIVGFKNRKGDNLLDVMIDDIWSERINVNDPVLQKVLGHMWAYSNREGVGVVYRDAIEYFEYNVPNNKKKFPNRLGEYSQKMDEWNSLSESDRLGRRNPILDNPLNGSLRTVKNHNVWISDIVGVHEDENYSRNIFYILCAMKAQGFPRPKYIYIKWNLAVYSSPELDADNN